MTPEKQAAALWIRLVKCSGLILQRVRRLPARSGLTLAQFDVLAQLLRRPGGMTSGELSRALLVTQGNVTGLVARLARRRLLRSSPPVADRRVKMIRLTRRGRTIAAREVRRHECRLNTLFRDLSPHEKAGLAAALDRLRRHLEGDPSHDARAKNVPLRA